MLNDEVGKDFRTSLQASDLPRSARSAIRILIVDPVMASRLFLADAVERSGFIAVTAPNSWEARIALDREDIALVLVDEGLSDAASGLHFLIELRNLFPATPRAMLTENGDLASMGKAVERAELAFLLRKPLDADVLREALQGVLLGDREFGGWEQIAMRSKSVLTRRVRSRERAGLTPSHPTKDHCHEVILRGILAGLNSVEFEDQLFAFIHDELAESFRIQHWLVLDENTGATKRLGETPSAGHRPGGQEPTPEEEALLTKAQSISGIRRLASNSSQDAASASGPACLAFGVGETGGRRLTCLIWCESACSEFLLEMLRDLRHGLNLTLRRIVESERRAEDARALAHRVSEELKTPVGALTHALHLMRGEAERAGMPTEWVDRVLSESQRVVRAVNHLEGEMLSERPSAPLTSHS